MFEPQLQAHANILKMIESGEFQQIKILDIDTSVAGPAKNGGQSGLFEIEGNGIFLLSSYFVSKDRKELSSATGRVAIFFNKLDSPGLVFSANGNSNSGSILPDLGGAVLSFQKIWVHVIGGVAGHLYFAILKGVNLSPGPIVSPNVGAINSGGSGMSGSYGG